MERFVEGTPPLRVLVNTKTTPPSAQEAPELRVWDCWGQGGWGGEFQAERIFGVGACMRKSQHALPRHLVLATSGDKILS